MAAVPELVTMVRAGDDDVEAAEVLAELSRTDPASAGRILGALTGDLDGTDPATRIRVAQALVELPGPGPRDALRRLAADPDRAVSLVAGAFADRRV